MRKIFLSAAVLSCLLTSGAFANWITGDSTVLAVNEGEAAFRTNLSSEQRFEANVTVGDSSKADVIFSTVSSTDKLSLSGIPVKIITGTNEEGYSYSDGQVALTPLINSDNGRRFYLMETGTAEGTKIISYHKGVFEEVFTASSVDADADGASIKAEKKDLILHLVKGDEASDYVLTYDGKTDSFNATSKA